MVSPPFFYAPAARFEQVADEVPAQIKSADMVCLPSSSNDVNVITQMSAERRDAESSC